MDPSDIHDQHAVNKHPDIVVSGKLELHGISLCSIARKGHKSLSGLDKLRSHRHAEEMVHRLVIACKRRMLQIPGCVLRKNLFCGGKRKKISVLTVCIVCVVPYAPRIINIKRVIRRIIYCIIFFAVVIIIPCVHIDLEQAGDILIGCFIIRAVPVVWIKKIRQGFPSVSGQNRISVLAQKGGYDSLVNRTSAPSVNAASSAGPKFQTVPLINPDITVPGASVSRLALLCQPVIKQIDGDSIRIHRFC